jgi:hypothetical protein
LPPFLPPLESLESAALASAAFASFFGGIWSKKLEFF